MAGEKEARHSMVEPFDVIVHPAEKPLSGAIVAQPSKNYTTRFLLAAALADGESTVGPCAVSDDAASLKRCLERFGAQLDEAVDDDHYSTQVTVKGFGGRPRLADSKTPVNVGNAGAVLRLLLGTGSLLPEVSFATDYPDSLGRRPNKDLLDALGGLGCRYESNAGRLPVTLFGGNLHGGEVSVSGAKSSQYLSSLLFLAPLIGEKVAIRVTDGLVSKAPVRQTLETLSRAGIIVTHTADMLHYEVESGGYRAGEFTVNGDWPGSAALLAAAAVTRGSIVVAGLEDDFQGEKACVDVLRRMGMSLLWTTGGIRTEWIAKQSLTGVEFDGDLATDAILALMGPACFAEGRSRFYNVSNLRLKECDRISDPIRELRKLGVACQEGGEAGDPDRDAILVDGNPGGYEGGAAVSGCGDHRVIMLLSIVALGCRRPVRITGAHHVAKSYPGWFDHLGRIGGRVEVAAPGA